MSRLMRNSIAVTEIRVPHALCKTEEQRQLLRTNLVHHSNKCIAFCNSLDTINDVSMIFLFESFLLASVFYGDQSTSVLRDLFAWQWASLTLLIRFQNLATAQSRV
jgi:hypothetical protein